MSSIKGQKAKRMMAKASASQTTRTVKGKNKVAKISQKTKAKPVHPRSKVTPEMASSNMFVHR